MIQAVSALVTLVGETFTVTELENKLDHRSNQESVWWTQKLHLTFS